MELSVFGSNRDIMKFLKSLPEQYTEENTKCLVGKKLSRARLKKRLWLN